jgi:hypothetical protein
VEVAALGGGAAGCSCCTVDAPMNPQRKFPGPDPDASRPALAVVLAGGRPQETLAAAAGVWGRARTPARIDASARQARRETPGPGDTARRREPLRRPGKLKRDLLRNFDCKPGNASFSHPNECIIYFSHS